MLDELRSGIVIVLLAMSSMATDQKHTLNKTSLYRNTHKTRFCTDQSTKMLCPGAPRNLTLHFPWKQWFQVPEFIVHRDFIKKVNFAGNKN